jgi:hypothetical protein
MKPKLLRFCASLSLTLLLSALPLWLLWHRADSARQRLLEIERSAGQTVRQQRAAATLRLERLDSAPAQLSPAAFLEWEAFCQAQPWPMLQAWADMDEDGALAAALAYPANTGSLKAAVINYVMRGRPQTESNADEWKSLLLSSMSNPDLEDIVEGLMSVDTDSAEHWMLKHQDGDLDDSLHQYFGVQTTRAPAIALAFAESLPAKLRRRDGVFTVVSRWARESPADATALLQAQGWSDARIARMKDRIAVVHPDAALWWWDW